MFLCLFFAPDLYAQQFHANPREACDSITVTFTYDSIAGYTATSWYWQFGNGDTSTLRTPAPVKYNMPGYYTIILTTNGTNVFTRNNYIFIHPRPDATFTYTDTSTPGSYAFEFVAPPKSFDSLCYNYHWSFGDNHQYTDTLPVARHKYKSQGEYTVMLIIKDTLGCRDTSTTKINVVDKLVVPNVFSPNNDGINDVFIVESNGVSSISMRIFSKWGQLIWEKTAPIIIWDGRTMNGQEIQAGIYYYVLEESEGVKKSGFIHLYK